MALSRGDGNFVGELAMDALAQMSEHYDDDVTLLAASVMLVVRDGSGVHIEVVSEER